MDLYSMSAAEAVEKLGSETGRGLSSREAEKRLDRDGENLLRGKKKKSLAAEFFEQFKDFTVIVLLIASGVSFATSFLEERGDFADPIMILIIVILNAAVGVIQQRRAEHSLEALKNMSAPTAAVIRDGKEAIIPASKLVRGDIIEVRAGDLVPADARLITSHSLFAQESALTGESVPCEKDARAAVKKGSEQAEIKNMIFSSTVITAGHARAVVTETGMDTAVGKIAHLLNTEDEPTTPLQIKLAKIGKALGIGALSVCALIFMLSILRGMGVLSAFMLSVSLAVAAIPEGLPAVVTVVLSLGVQRMAKSNAVIRRLPAVETLGAATYICSDKTGTLTQNKMTVTAACSASDEIPLTGDAAKKLFALAALCCDAKHTGKGEVSGEPTEAAIVAAAERSGTDTEKLRRKMPRTDEVPFSSERKMMSVAIKDGDKAITVAKGAPDVLIKHCTDIILNGRKIPMTSALREKILRLNSSLADRALRVIAVAAGDTKNGKPDETGLAFCGLIGMEDPPRKEAYEAVKTCRRAGITPVMITGDHAGTACATAKKLGILSRSGECLTGAQIDKMGENEFAQAVRTCRVYARVTPEHKVRIVKALRAHGEVVAMTGDGVNDAPALKAADIGCAMGKGGTQVAQNAADMILTDDNFATIVKAVAGGRGIYDNIRRAIHYLLGCNIGEILCVFAATLFGMPAPLLPIQLLFINLVTDSLPALALGAEMPDSRVMQRPPRDSAKSFFADRTGLDIALEGMLIGALSLFAFVAGNSLFKNSCVELGRTMAFAAQSLCEIAHSFNMRSRRSVFSIGIFSNRKLTVCAALCAALQLTVMTVPPLAALFNVSALTPAEWLTVAALAISPIAFSELGKAVGGKRETE
ncbi:MAG TPA: calcium-translocating P-type ATPase, PMCA-type [Ruminococcaceae bacterium]|nr:calcium-translocating P-type ATPase, PMCA-type [Oscillospiraceae bacterium]